MTFFTHAAQDAVPVYFFTRNDFADFLKKQKTFLQHWASTTGFVAEPNTMQQVPDSAGKLAAIWCGIVSKKDFWVAGQLPLLLPAGVYQFCFDRLADTPNQAEKNRFILAFGLGCYQFSYYKKPTRQPAVLYIEKISGEAAKEKNAYLIQIKQHVAAICHVRDLITLPAENMGPTELAAAASALAEEYQARCKILVGDTLLKKGFSAIHTVGRASDDAPRFIDLQWGKPSHFKVTLVGKGVCFDTGGLDIKPSNAMLLMKKDMAGAAHVLGLAQMIMAAKLPVCLRVLIPAVENAISGSAYRPGDVIRMRNGKTVEIGNTDAEGRLVLADALDAAIEDQPDLLIDIATLTGAARVAVGTDIAAYFCNDEKLAADIMGCGEEENDPLWRLPLFMPYRENLKSTIADINNVSQDGYAGAILAGLFLKEFVPDTIPWLHFDVMAWNMRTRPGRPQGGEAMALRALFKLIALRVKK